MSEAMIFEGNTTNEAIENGLKKLKVKKSDVEIKVLEEEKRSFFSILEKRVVKVEMKIKEKNEKKINPVSNESLEKGLINIERFLEKLIPTLSNENLEYDAKINNGYIEIIINGQDVNHLIGYRGDTLNSLQIILASVAGKNIEEKIKVTLDISGYKEKRKKILISLAEKEARRVLKTRKSIALEPMSAYERKIIHTALQNHPRVTTKSVGEGMNRKVIIHLK